MALMAGEGTALVAFLAAVDAFTAHGVTAGEQHLRVLVQLQTAWTCQLRQQISVHGQGQTNLPLQPASVGQYRVGAEIIHNTLGFGNQRITRHQHHAQCNKTSTACSPETEHQTSKPSTPDVRKKGNGSHLSNWHLNHTARTIILFLRRRLMIWSSCKRRAGRSRIGQVRLEPSRWRSTKGKSRKQK